MAILLHYRTCCVILKYYEIIINSNTSTYCIVYVSKTNLLILSKSVEARRYNVSK